MTQAAPSLGDVCTAHLLHTKWLLAPSYQIGHQWIESLVRDRGSVVNLQPTTATGLALELIATELTTTGETLADPVGGALITKAAWPQLSPSGYFGRLLSSVDLSEAVFESISALRLAGSKPDQILPADFENDAKADDIKLLWKAYEAFLKRHQLVDNADVLERAIRHLQNDPQAIDGEVLLLVPAGEHFGGLEGRFITAWPGAKRVEIQHPAEPSPVLPTPDIRLLSNLGKPAMSAPTGDGSFQFFRAVGETNEVREVLRRILSTGQSLDDVELLYTDSATYIPLIYGAAQRYFSELDRPDGVPVTFAQGIPVSVSHPGRALAAWLRWIDEGYPQRLLVEMFGNGFLDTGDEGLGFGYLAGLLRPLAIGKGANNYLPKIDEQIQAIDKPPKPTDDETPGAAEARERKKKGLKGLRKLVKQLLSLSQELVSGDSRAAAQAAVKFLGTLVRTASRLDQVAATAIVEQLENRRLWLERLGLAFELRSWLASIPGQTRVWVSGPKPGHLHVAPLESGGHSGRGRTFVLGLDDRRFPGAALQDPILLDRERSRISSELSTSAGRLRHKVDQLAVTLSRLRSVTLSWSCQDVVADRECFPSSAILGAYRLVSGRTDVDLDLLNDAVGPPVSFAPTAAEKALDESDLWLWQLAHDEPSLGTNRTAVVEAFYPHLARGSEANALRRDGFGPFNGFVPQAGQDFNPFASTGSVLSASALETVGRCPLAFFFKKALSLAPEEPEFDEDCWLDAAQFGSLMHGVFRTFMADLAAAGQRPEFERDHKRLGAVLRDAIEQWRGDIPPPNENAFRTQTWQLVRTAQIFLQYEEEFCRTSQPRYFEVALGLGEPANTPLDVSDPIAVRLPGGDSIRARGQVDRVDETAPSRYAIWDYKISSGYGYDQSNPFVQGRRVQSVLYLRMIESVLQSRLGSNALVDRFGYFFPSVRAQGLRIDWDAATLSSGMAILERLCRIVEAGTFIATNKPDDCRYCDYASICRDVQQVTSHSQSLLGHDDLVSLKHFQELRDGQT